MSTESNALSSSGVHGALLYPPSDLTRMTPTNRRPRLKRAKSTASARFASIATFGGILLCIAVVNYISSLYALRSVIPEGSKMTVACDHPEEWKASQGAAAAEEGMKNSRTSLATKPPKLVLSPKVEAFANDLGPLCIGPEHAIVPVANAEERKKVECRLQETCDPEQVQLSWEPIYLPKYYRKDKEIIIWQADIGQYSTFNPKQTNYSIAQWPPLSSMRFESGPSILLDPCVGAMQFGHSMTALLKLVIMADTGFYGEHLVHFLPEDPSHHDKTRWKSQVLQTLEDFLVQGAEAKSVNNRGLLDRPYHLNSSQLATQPTETMCFQHALKPKCFERYYHTSDDVERVHAFLRRRLPWFAPTAESCPPPVAAVLYRSGKGMGLRKILDYDAIDYALKKNGISKYVNITVSQQTSLEESVKLFSSFGLLIATHSSQLKLLAFAHPDTIVVELRAKTTGKEQADYYKHSVFSEGPDVLGIHYFAHTEHEPVDCHSPKERCERNGNIYADILPNKTALADVIQIGLDKQNKRCHMHWE